MASAVAASASPRRSAPDAPIAEVAAVARMAETEVRVLRADESFVDLVEHYRRTTGLPEAERMAALRAQALALLALAMEAGDVRVAVFFTYEELHGRDPVTSLVKAAVRAVEHEPRPAPATPPAPPRREDDFPYCAATKADESEAELLAVEEARRLESRIGATGRALATKLVAEAEREGIAAVDPLADAAAAWARDAHRRPAAAMPAANAWQERRCASAQGRLPMETPGDPAHPGRPAIDDIS